MDSQLDGTRTNQADLIAYLLEMERLLPSTVAEEHIQLLAELQKDASPMVRGVARHVFEPSAALNTGKVADQRTVFCLIETAKDRRHTMRKLRIPSQICLW